MSSDCFQPSRRMRASRAAPASGCVLPAHLRPAGEGSEARRNQERPIRWRAHPPSQVQKPCSEAESSSVSFVPAGDFLVSQDMVEQLSHGAFGLENRATKVHDSSQISIGKCNTAEGRSSQDFAGSGLSVPAEEKPGLRIQIGVTPAVQNDSLNIAPRIKTEAAKHFSKLLA